MHSIKIHKVIALLISSFYLIGLWHRGDKPTIKEIRIKLFCFVYYLLFVLSLGVGAITNEKQDQSIFLTGEAIGGAVLTVKLWFSIWKQDQILDFLNRVCVFSIRNDEDYRIFNEKLRGFMKCVLVFVIFVTVTGSIMCVILPFVGSEKTLFVEIAFPMDYENNEIAFWIATIFLVNGALLSIITILFSIIIWYLLLTCSLRYEVLGSELRNMGRTNDNTEVEMTEHQMQSNFFEDLQASIDAHLHLKKLTDELGSFFSDLFLIQFGTSGLCICGSIYCLAFDVGHNVLERTVYLSACLYFIAEIFMITYFGNEIMLSSNRLSYSLFKSDWYNQPQSTKKCILVFGEYLKKPQDIVIGKLYPLTLATFTRILNSAYSMFNILKSFQQ